MFETLRMFQYFLDRSAPHMARRWFVSLAAAAIYILRVYYQGFYVISYGLTIYILNLLIGFMSPKVDPEIETLDSPSLPTKDSDEFRPFVHRLSEFLFWTLPCWSHRGLVPTMEHYACVVDLQGCVGRLHDAFEFIMRIPFEPDMMV